MSDPRARFVEALRQLREREERAVSGFLSGGGAFEWQRQAVEAFADAECGVSADCIMHNAGKWPEEFGPVNHLQCRAALLRACGLEG